VPLIKRRLTDTDVRLHNEDVELRWYLLCLAGKVTSDWLCVAKVMPNPAPTRAMIESDAVSQKRSIEIASRVTAIPLLGKKGLCA
jgi:hypothetical protein